MLDKARRERDSCISIVTKWENFTAALDKGHMVLAPWCELIESEVWVKNTTKDEYRQREIAKKAKTGETVEEDDGKGLTGALMDAVLGEYYFQPGNGILKDVERANTPSPDMFNLKNKRND